MSEKFQNIFPLCKNTGTTYPTGVQKKTGFQLLKWIFYCTVELRVQSTGCTQLSHNIRHYYDRKTWHFGVSCLVPAEFTNIRYLWKSLFTSHYRLHSRQAEEYGVAVCHRRVSRKCAVPTSAGTLTILNDVVCVLTQSHHEIRLGYDHLLPTNELQGGKLPL